MTALRAAQPPRGALAILAAAALATIACVPGVLQTFGLLDLGPVPLMPASPIVLFLLGIGLQGEARRVVLTACGCGLLVLVAVYATVFVDASPILGYVPAAILAGSLAVARFPVAATLGIAAISGAYGTIGAYFEIKHGQVVDLVLVSLWLAAIWTLARHGTAGRAWIWPGVAVVGAYLLVTFFSIGLAEETNAAFRSFRSSHWYAMAFILIAYAPWPEGAQLRLAQGLMLIGLGVGAYALLRWQIGPSPEERRLATASTHTNFVDGELGVFGSFPSRKSLAAWSALVIPLCLGYAIAMSDGWRAIGAAGAVALLGAVFVSEVRIGLMAAVAGAVVVLALVQLAPGLPGARLGVGIVAIIAAAAVGIGGFALVTSGKQDSQQRFENILTPENDQSVQGRIFKWREAISEIDERPLGHGLGTAGLGQLRDARFVNLASLDLDNGYLKVAYEQGLFFAVLYALALGALLVGLVLRVLSAMTPTGVAFGAAGCGTLVALLVLMTAGSYQEGQTALVAWIVVGLAAGQFTRLPGPRADAG